MMSFMRSDSQSDDENLEVNGVNTASGEQDEEISNPGDIFQPIPVPPPAYSTRASATIESTEPELQYADLSNTLYFAPEEIQWVAEYILQKQAEERCQEETLELEVLLGDIISSIQESSTG